MTVRTSDFGHANPIRRRVAAGLSALCLVSAAACSSPSGSTAETAQGTSRSTHTLGELCAYPQPFFVSTWGVRPDIATVGSFPDPTFKIGVNGTCTYRGSDSFDALANLAKIDYPDQAEPLKETTEEFLGDPSLAGGNVTNVSVDGSTVQLTELPAQGLDLRVERDGWRLHVFLAGPGQPLRTSIPDERHTAATTVVSMLDALRGS